MAVDQRLELHTLLPALVEAGLITPDIARRVSALPADSTLHPLECIAAHGPCLETLTQWLARHAGQPYLRIDPLNIDVAAVVPLMSHGFAQRHGILAIAVDTHTLTVASAQPHVTGWEAGLAQVLKRSIKRVVANPQAIQRCIGEFYRLAKSVSTIVAEELMLVAMVDMPAEKSDATTSPVSPVGSPWTMNHGKT